MSHRKRLNFFGSPLNEDPEKLKRTESHSDEHTFSSLHRAVTNASVAPFHKSDTSHIDEPTFHRHAEATSSELFYDLFFVANLTTFTSILQINSGITLTAYIGFFCLLWFTWYQVSLYDVRFSSDSVFDRICKAVQFGVMVGFAVMGPQWKPGLAADKGDYHTFRAFTIILIVSRMMLIMQYASTMYFTWRYRRTRLPLMLVILSYSIAAITYASLAALIPTRVDVSTGEPIPNEAYIGWYVIAVAETLLTTVVSCRWRIISFKGTHLAQRMSLLTLIVLGEGIIVVCKAISGIVKNYFVFTPSVVGQIAAAVLTIYLLYMLYFDRLEEAPEHFGTIRQQIWSFLHFPLHISLVLVLQGVAQFINWRSAITGCNRIIRDLHTDFNQTYASAQDFAKKVNATAWNEVFLYLPKGFDSRDEQNAVNHSLTEFVTYWGDNSPSAVEAQRVALSDLINALRNTIVESMSIVPPKPKKGLNVTIESETDALYRVFDLVFIYFFVTSGLALIILGTLGWIAKPPKKTSDFIRGGVNFIIGLALCLLSLMHFSYGQGNLSMSPWVLPVLCLSLTLVIAVNHVRIHKRKSKDEELGDKHKSRTDHREFQELKDPVIPPSPEYKKNRKQVIFQVGHLHHESS